MQGQDQRRDILNKGKNRSHIKEEGRHFACEWKGFARAEVKKEKQST